MASELLVHEALSSTPNTAPAGSMFDNMVFIAMENQNYGSVMGTGTGSSIAPFVASLLPSSSTIPFFHGFGASGRMINGCSAGCYLALTSGSDQAKPTVTAPDLQRPVSAERTS